MHGEERVLGWGSRSGCGSKGWGALLAGTAHGNGRRARARYGGLLVRRSGRVPYLDERPAGLPYEGHVVVHPLVILIVPRVHCLLPVDLLRACQLSTIAKWHRWRGVRKQGIAMLRWQGLRLARCSNCLTGRSGRCFAYDVLYRMLSIDVATSCGPDRCCQSDTRRRNTCIKGC